MYGYYLRFNSLFCKLCVAPSLEAAAKLAEEGIEAKVINIHTIKPLDEELLALASDVYRNGFYDEVILTYLMKYRFGPVDDLFAIWKSARGFELDTYDLEEKILELLMFTEDYRKEGEQILESYIHHSGREWIVSGYLTHVSYGIFVKEFTMSSFVKNCLVNAYMQKWPVNEVCHLALFKELSRDKGHKEALLSIERDLLKKCVEKGMVFSFFHRLPSEQIQRLPAG